MQGSAEWSSQFKLLNRPDAVENKRLMLFNNHRINIFLNAGSRMASGQKRAI